MAKTVEECMEDPQKAWKLAKWGRTKAGIPLSLPYFPLLHDNEGVQHHDYEMKANLIAQSLYPQPTPVDLGDIQTSNYLPPVQINKDVSEEDILQNLKELAPDKVPGPDQITSRCLKNCGETLAPILACFFDQMPQIGISSYALRRVKDNIPS